MRYPEELVRPMRAELTRLGISETREASDVDSVLDEAREGTTLVVINSVCGCAAANARPAVAMALQSPVVPDRSFTVFAGQDLDATARVREHLAGIPPSSPFIALLKDGDPAYIIERRHIEGRSASAIAADLVTAFEKFCGDNGAENGTGPARPDVQEAPASKDLPPTFRSIL